MNLVKSAAMASIVALAACVGGGGGTEQPTAKESPAASQVRVIDADTVDVDGTRYRLFGIDAPETRQTCRALGRTWDCGAAATEALMSRAEGMTCEGGDTDRFGRTVGVCSSGGADLNAWLVANGWALAYRQFSEDYVNEEEQARSSRRGIHRGEFVEPWDWRRGERLEGEDSFAAIASGPLDVAAIGIDDFARPDVDVALTGIADSGGRARADLRWNDIPLANGAFRSNTAGSIEGRFYGNDHREVGGILERDRLLGAFGASR